MLDRDFLEDTLTTFTEHPEDNATRLQIVGEKFYFRPIYDYEIEYCQAQLSDQNNHWFSGPIESLPALRNAVELSQRPVESASITCWQLSLADEETSKQLAKLPIENWTPIQYDDEHKLYNPDFGRSWKNEVHVFEATEKAIDRCNTFRERLLERCKKQYIDQTTSNLHLSHRAHFFTIARVSKARIYCKPNETFAITLEWTLENTSMWSVAKISTLSAQQFQSFEQQIEEQKIEPVFGKWIETMRRMLLGRALYFTQSRQQQRFDPRCYRQLHIQLPDIQSQPPTKALSIAMGELLNGNSLPALTSKDVVAPGNQNGYHQCRYGDAQFIDKLVEQQRYNRWDATGINWGISEQALLSIGNNEFHRHAIKDFHYNDYSALVFYFISARERLTRFTNQLSALPSQGNSSYRHFERIKHRHIEILHHYRFAKFSPQQQPQEMAAHLERAMDFSTTWAHLDLEVDQSYNYRAAQGQQALTWLGIIVAILALFPAIPSLFTAGTPLHDAFSMIAKIAVSVTSLFIMLQCMSKAVDWTVDKCWKDAPL